MVNLIGGNGWERRQASPDAAVAAAAALVLPFFSPHCFRRRPLPAAAHAPMQRLLHGAAEPPEPVAADEQAVVHGAQEAPSSPAISPARIAASELVSNTEVHLVGSMSLVFPNLAPTKTAAATRRCAVDGSTRIPASTAAALPKNRVR